VTLHLAVATAPGDDRADDGSIGGADAVHLFDILDRIECHLYTGEIWPDGSYRELFTGPGLEALLGGQIPAGVDPADAWESAIHPDDYARQADLAGGQAQ
jgi:hypothetical protein